MPEPARKLNKKPDQHTALAWDSATALKASVEGLLVFGKLLRSNWSEPDPATLVEIGKALDALEDQLDHLLRQLDNCDKEGCTWCIRFQERISRARKQY